jgi:glycosyltransferase involved in cell wall biosynthesis
MRWFTCTPVEFGGAADFFARDSGLLCRGFQSLGIESRAVMPGVRRPDDEADLIRTEFGNLESPEWWKSQRLDGVVLYAWGRPKFRKVAAAIHEAGIFLILNQDNGGLVSPLAGSHDWLREQWIMTGGGRGTLAWLEFAKRTLRGVTAGVFLTDPLRAAHLRNGDVIACVSPKAAEHYRRLCRMYGGGSMATRVTVLPHAVEPRFLFDGREKQRRIACVGRWNDEVQKRPWLLMDVIEGLLAKDSDVCVVIAGKATADMHDWHGRMDAPKRKRVQLCGRMEREALAEMLADSQIFYSPSAFESFGIAAAEALCAGCSVVAGRSVSMASFEWFVSEESGTLAESDAVADHLAALNAELEHWDAAQRNAARISEIWCERLYAEKVAATIVGMIG